MKYPRYPKYRPSGVEWIGEVPDHWRIKPLKHMAAINVAAGRWERWKSPLGA